MRPLITSAYSLKELPDSSKENNVGGAQQTALMKQC